MGAFLLTFVGTLLATALVGVIDSRYRHPKEAPSGVHGYPSAKLLRFSAFSVALGWLGLLAAFICLLTMWVSGTANIGFLICMAVAVPLGLLGQLLALRIRCVTCARRLLTQVTTKAKYSEKVYGVEGGSAIVVRIVRRQPFRCMHCGQRYAA